MNKISLIGRLTKDLELKFTTNGTAIAKGTIAVNRRFVKDDTKQKADFFNLEFWGKTAEIADKYLKKGNQVGISGRMAIDTWKDDEDNFKTFPKVVVEEMDFIESKENNGALSKTSDSKVELDDGDELPF